MAQPGMPGSQFPGEDAQGRRVKDLERQVQQFSAANVLATAGIGVIPNGVLVNGLMQFKRADGTIGVQVDPADGTFVAYNAAGTSPVARFGSLVETSPGNYGVEVLVGSTWVQVGAQSTTWDTVSGKPGWASNPSSIAGTNISGTVANATEAVHAAQADGSQYGWTNNVAGTEFYALWVGNDGGYHLGRNVSSIKYKENVTDAAVTPEGVLALRPVKYDRKATYRYPEDADGNRLIGPEQKFEGARNQFGLIAEEVAEHVPELVTRFGGEIDGVSYELGFVALLPVVQDHDARISALEEQNATQAADIAALKQAVRDLGGNI